MIKRWWRWAVLCLLFLLPLVAYVLTFHGALSDNHGRWGEFGAFLGGAYGSLALLILTYNTLITRRQFQRQNEDEYFFRLYDSLRGHLARKMAVGGREILGQQALEELVSRIRSELLDSSIDLARRLLMETPGDLKFGVLDRVLLAAQPTNTLMQLDPHKSDAWNFTELMRTAANAFDRSERLKSVVGSRGDEPGEVRHVLEALGSVNFYKVEFSQRRNYYKIAVERTAEAYGEIADGYFRSTGFAFEFAIAWSTLFAYSVRVTSPLSLRRRVRGRRKAASAFPPSLSMKKTYVYIDGFNLYYGSLKATPYRWLDLERLCKLMLPSNDVVRINYYTARVGARVGDPDQPLRQQTYLRALGTQPTVRVHLGHYLSHPVWMPLETPPLTGSKFVRVIKTEEKGSDVNLATHLISDAYEDAFDVAALITNDSDLLAPVDLVRNRLGKIVGVLNPQKHPAIVLAKAATFIKTIRSGVLRASQLPDELTDTHGTFAKPAGW